MIGLNGSAFCFADDFNLSISVNYFTSDVLLVHLAM